MGSRTSAGARILQENNVKSIRHEGDRLSVGDSLEDTVDSRELNTSFRPPDGSASRD